MRSRWADFVSATVLSPIFVADNTKGDDFDNLPDIDQTCDLLMKIFKIPLKIPVESFPLNPRSSRYGYYIHSSRVRRGGGGVSVPPARRVRPNTPAGCGLGKD